MVAFDRAYRPSWLIRANTSLSTQWNMHRWMLSTIPDLLMQYSFHAPEGQQLKVGYFRNKGA